ncbi:lysophospholipase [Burkholderiaceae bacterium DAT-1]|nr:lysophospholipase [Burkholderiaceae bacterium DAT-1]
METLKLPAPDGVLIPLCHWPHAEPRAVLLILHGMSEYASRYDRFARYLNTQGVAVVAHDHRGHGMSPVAQGCYGPGGWDAVLGDVARVRQQVEQLYPGRPVFLLGHSMGSFIARGVWSQPKALPYAGLILSATGYRQTPIARVMRGIARSLGKRRRDQASRFMERLVFGSFNLNFFPARTRMDWLSRDQAEVDAYIADPLCGFAPSWGLWEDLFVGIIALEAAEKAGTHIPKAAPVLLMTGSRDPVGMGKLAPGQMAKVYRAAGVQEIETQIWPDGRHEMLNETNRDEVMNHVAAWIASV